jgi:NaMN:DMB phosphoribosyltransferase
VAASEEIGILPPKGFGIMQLCAHCGVENQEGTIYCERCGVALVPMPLATRQLSTDQADRMAVSTLGPEGILILQVGSEANPTMFRIKMKKEVVLGRVTDFSEGTTYINLTPHGAEEGGVSRRHARLMRDNNAVYLMDLNSTNGTRLNGEPLPASAERRLQDGDEIMLGRLKVYVFFQP